MIRFVFDQLFKFLRPLFTIVVWFVGIFVPNHVSGPFPVLNLLVLVSQVAIFYAAWQTSAFLAWSFNRRYPSDKWRFLPASISVGLVLLCNAILSS